MSSDADQARWLHETQRLSPEEQRRAWSAYRASAGQGSDFLGFLEARGALTAAEVAAARAQSEKARHERPRLGRYVIERELNRGGMGVLSLGRDPASRDAVAIKTIIDGTKDLRELLRFEREAAALASLAHPNLVRFWEAGEAGGRPYFVMSLIDGEPLQARARAVAKDGPEVLARWACEVLADIADALVTVHAAGLVHRDLKPANILIERRTERPVLVDFGLAGQITGSAEEVEARLTQTGEALGTPAYMAPEQLDGGRAPVTEKTDVWGLGATLAAALTGAPPYGALDALGTFKQLLKGDPPPIRERAPEVPLRLSELCQACLQRDPAARPTMAELRDALREESHSPRPRRGRALPLIFIVAALACISALIALTVGLPAEPPAPPQSPTRLAWTVAPPTSVLTDTLTLELEVAGFDELRLSALAVATGAVFRLSEALSEAGGRVTVRVPLEPGVNELHIRAGRRDPPSSADLELEVTRETLPLALRSRLPEEGATVFDEHFDLPLQTTHPLPGLRWSVAVTRADAPAPSPEAATLLDDRVRVRLAPGPQTICLTVTDGLGRRAQLTRRLTRGETVDLAEMRVDNEPLSATLKRALEGAPGPLRVRLAAGRYEDPVTLPERELLELCGPPEGTATFVLDPSEREPTAMLVDGGRVLLRDIRFEGRVTRASSTTSRDPSVPEDQLVYEACLTLRRGALILERCRLSGDAPLLVTLPVPVGPAPPQRALWMADCELTGGWVKGLYAAGDNAVVARGCRFRGAGEGEGFSLKGASTLELEGCEFVGYAAWSGNLQDTTTLVARDSSFDGLRFRNESTIRLEDCRFPELEEPLQSGREGAETLTARLDIGHLARLTALRCAFEGGRHPAFYLSGKPKLTLSGCRFGGGFALLNSPARLPAVTTDRWPSARPALQALKGAQELEVFWTGLGTPPSEPGLIAERQPAPDIAPMPRSPLYPWARALLEGFEKR